ncbi:MAG: flagellar hook-associated protein FlgK [Lachnospiraceae bacterium]|nr:flagellar hook-associated protein FlgK [Lachnospiraceae bacterium]
MSSLLTAFDVGVTGLKAAHIGVNTTSHNLVNVNTDGYTRQRVHTTDRTYNTVTQTHISEGQVGLGAEINRIAQVRDQFFDRAYRVEVGRKCFYEVQSNAVDEVENLLGEMEGMEFQDSLHDVWNAVEELVKEPDSLVKRTSLVNTCNTFMLRAQDVYSQLKSYQYNLNQQIKDAVEEVNEIGKKIFALNKKIVSAEVGGEIANDYRDQRNLLLDKLAEYASITYSEDVDGRVLVNLEGNMFVSMDCTFKLHTQEYEDNSFVDVVWAENEPVYILSQGYSSENDTDIGKIKSLLFARGDGTKNYTDIPKDYSEDENSEDYSNYTSVEQYKRILKEFNNGTNSSVVASAQAYFDKLIHAVVTAVNDAICPNDSAENVLNNLGYDSLMVSSIVNEDGEAVEYEDLADLIILDEYHSGIGIDANASIGEEIFSRQSVARYKEAVVTFSDGTTRNIKIYNQEQQKNLASEDEGGDTFTLYTIEQLIINQNVLDNPSVLALAGNNYLGGMDGYDVNACERLSEVWQLENLKIDPNTATKYSFVDYYNNFVGNVATDGKRFRSTTESQQSLVDSIDSNRSQVAGVSSDEELTNLIQFSYAYTANSKYIMTVDRMLEDLLNKLG